MVPEPTHLASELVVARCQILFCSSRFSCVSISRYAEGARVGDQVWVLWVVWVTCLLHQRIEHQLLDRLHQFVGIVARLDSRMYDHLYTRRVARAAHEIIRVNNGERHDRDLALDREFETADLEPLVKEEGRAVVVGLVMRWWG
jgi:hypothetical protein